MPLFAPSDRPFCTTLAELAYCNPFLPRRTVLERQALGGDFDDRYAQWNVERDVAAEQRDVQHRIVDLLREGGRLPRYAALDR